MQNLEGHRRPVSSRATVVALLTAMLVLASGCTNYTTRRDKTGKGAGIGAAAGAVAAILKGEREADEILAGAAIGAVVGTGVGAYMDHQEERFARIPNTEVERLNANTLLVRFDSNVLFAVDSAIVNDAGRSTLDEVAGVLTEFRKTAVVVHGHTDSTGSEEHNQGLSERRAQSVGNHLIMKGVNQRRLATFGFGEGYPRTSNDTASGRSLNRRVEILLKAKAV